MTSRKTAAKETRRNMLGPTFARALTKQRTEETRKTTGLSQSRTEAVKQASDPGDGKGTVQPYQTTDPKEIPFI